MAKAFLQFPVYRMYGMAFCKIESYEDMIEVEVPMIHDIRKEFSISLFKNQYEKHIEAALDSRASYSITKEQFQEAFDKALNHINHAALMQTVEPTMSDMRDFHTPKEIYKRNEKLNDSLNNIGKAENWNP